MTQQGVGPRRTSELFRARRVEAGLSVQELAAKASAYAGRPIQPKTLYRIENDELVDGPRMATVRAVAEALGLSPVDLLGDDVLGASA